MTQNHPHYAQAPITEAVIDIRVAQSPTSSVDNLKDLQVGDAYPTIEPLHLNVGQFQFGPNPSATTSAQHMGFLYKSADAKQLFQAQTSGFSLSRLTPYQSWDPFSEEAKRLWGIYKSKSNPINVVRMALRYINRIDIPLPIKDFKDYLRTVPEVSPDLPQGLSGYVMQLAIPLESIKGMAIISETIIPPSSADFVSILLDIDVSVESLVPPESPQVWETFNNLRNKKNEVFEACITDNTRELFRKCQH